MGSPRPQAAGAPPREGAPARPTTRRQARPAPLAFEPAPDAGARARRAGRLGRERAGGPALGPAGRPRRPREGLPPARAGPPGGAGEARTWLLPLSVLLGRPTAPCGQRALRANSETSCDVTVSKPTTSSVPGSAGPAIAIRRTRFGWDTGTSFRRLLGSGLARCAQLGRSRESLVLPLLRPSPAHGARRSSGTGFWRRAVSFGPSERCFPSHSPYPSTLDRPRVAARPSYVEGLWSLS